MRQLNLRFRYRLGTLMLVIAGGTLVVQLGAWCWRSVHDGREALRHAEQEEVYRTAAQRLWIQSEYLAGRAELEELSRSAAGTIIPVSTGGMAGEAARWAPALRRQALVLEDLANKHGRLKQAYRTAALQPWNGSPRVAGAE